MKGSCLCGAIEVSAPDASKVGVCHCSMCRRWGGGPLLSVHCGKHVAFGGSRAPAAYRSSEWTERGFCPVCGTHLFYRLLPSDEYVLPAGLFQDREFEMSEQIFVDEKPGYYDFANRTPMLTGAEVFAKFAEGPA